MRIPHYCPKYILNCLLSVSLAMLAMPAGAAILLVTNNLDSGVGSLRQAISDNRIAGGGNIIAFSNNVTGTITLSSGELVINTNVTVSGPGQSVLTISGNNGTRVLHITAGNVTISGLTFARGKMNNASGAGILQEAGTLVLSACTLTNNNTGILGGGMEGRAQVRASDCTFANNNGTNGVGGIFQSSGTLALSNCTFFGNQGSFGGGIWVSNAVAQIVNCTVVSNTAGFGGGLYSESGISVGVTNSTFYYNTAVYGGGMFDQSPITTVRNSIVASNFATATAVLGQDCYGTFISGGFNLIGTTNNSAGWTGTGDLLGSAAIPLNAVLGPLQNNGGLTLTMAPSSSSPAVDHGNNSGITVDQRGRPRPFDDPGTPNGAGNGTDIGAVELSPFSIVVSNLNDSGAGSLRQAIAAASPVDNDMITFAPNLTGTLNLSSGELSVGKIVTIFGPGPKRLTVSGNNLSRVFNITAAHPTICGLTIANGRVAPAIAAFEQNGTDAVGGGIFNQASLTLSNCIVTSNSVVGGQGGPTTANVGGNGGKGLGGAIYNLSGLGLYSCIVSNNQAIGGAGGADTQSGFGGSAGNGLGGGVCSLGGNSVGIFFMDSLLDNNLAMGGAGGTSSSGNPGNGGQGYGGALYTESGPSYIFTSTFSHSRGVGVEGGSGYGGGIYNGQFLELFTCTIASNSVSGSGFDFGGGLFDSGTFIYIRNSTVAGNQASYGGGLYLSGSVDLGSTLLAGNTIAGGVGPDGSGTINSAGCNFVQNTNGLAFIGTTTNNIYNQNPVLGPLQYNGGFTPTMALLSGSPAIDKGQNWSGTTDQRGRTRPFDFLTISNAFNGDGTDIGAFEVNPPILSIARAGTNVVLSWSTNDTGYTLEFKTNATAATLWAPVPGTPVPLAGQFTVSNSATPMQKIYRLRNP